MRLCMKLFLIITCSPDVRSLSDKSVDELQTKIIDLQRQNQLLRKENELLKQRRPPLERPKSTMQDRFAFCREGSVITEEMKIEIIEQQESKGKGHRSKRSAQPKGVSPAKNERKRHSQSLISELADDEALA